MSGFPQHLFDFVKNVWFSTASLKLLDAKQNNVNCFYKSLIFNTSFRDPEQAKNQLSLCSSNFLDFSG